MLALLLWPCLALAAPMPSTKSVVIRQELRENPIITNIVEQINQKQFPYEIVQAVSEENEGKCSQLVAKMKLDFGFVGALFTAIRGGSFKMVKWCFRQKYSFKNDKVMYASVLIALNTDIKNIEIIEFLVPKLKPSLIDDNIVIIAVQTQDTDIASLFIDKAGKDFMLDQLRLNLGFSQQIFGSPIYRGNIEMVKYLFKSGAKLNADDGTLGYIAASIKRADILQVLIDNGLNLENRNIALPLLNGAFENDDAEMVRFMLSKGLKPTFENMRHGMSKGTPLCMDEFLQYPLDLGGLNFVAYVGQLFSRASVGNPKMVSWLALHQEFHHGILFVSMVGLGDLDDLKIMHQISPDVWRTQAVMEIIAIEVVRAATENNADPAKFLEILEYVLDNGAELYTDSCEAFFTSINEGRVDFVKSFLVHGFNIDLETDQEIIKEQLPRTVALSSRALLEQFPTLRHIAIAFAKYREDLPMLKILQSQWKDSSSPSSSGAVKRHEIEMNNSNPNYERPAHSYLRHRMLKTQVNRFEPTSVGDDEIPK